MAPRILESMFQYWFLLPLTKSLFTCTYYFQCFIFILMSLLNSVFSKWITNNICQLNKYDQQLGKTAWGTQYYSSTSFPEKTKINEPFVKQKQLEDVTTQKLAYPILTLKDHAQQFCSCCCHLYFSNAEHYTTFGVSFLLSKIHLIGFKSKH